MRFLHIVMVGFAAVSAASTEVVAGTVRDAEVEIANLADCLGGPDSLPDPAGGTPAQCLNMFDYDGDDDVDLKDHYVYLQTLPVDGPPRIELGDAFSQAYEPINDGDTVRVYNAGQEVVTNLFVSIRGFGFPDSVTDPFMGVQFERSGINVGSGETVIFPATETTIFPENGVGMHEIQNFFVIMFLGPDEAEGEVIDLTFTARSRPFDNPTHEASITLRLTLGEVVR